MEEKKGQEVETTEVEDKEKKAEKKEQEKEVKAEEEKKYSDKDLDKIIQDKFKKWKQAEEEKINEAKKLAAMNENQKTEYERDKLKKELEQLKFEKTISDMTTTARGILQEKGLNIADGLIKTFVTQNADETRANIENFIDLFNLEVEKRVTEQLKGQTPKKMNGGKLSKKDILDVKDAFERQKLISQNLELFE